MTYQPAPPFGMSPIEGEREPDAAPTVVMPDRRPRRPRWLLGLIGVGVAVCAAVVHAIAIIRASGLDWEGGTTLAWVAIVLTAVSFLVGLVAVILNRGRRLGVVAMVLSVIANPLVLVWVFRLLG